MKPERWQQVENLFLSVLERQPAERTAFLDQACREDEELRREVETLLAYEEQARSFIESPAIDLAARALADDQNRITVGRSIGPYKILLLLGRGGMAEVYLARDTRLGRKVALKLLPVTFTRDEERVRRFRQEARAASALNHPNILTIHEIGELDGIHFIATEFIEGETLRQHLNRKKLGFDEVLEIAIQVASALAAAHEEGIVHRDIKPENIMLRPDGYVKVLDFGLAKLTEQQVSTDSEAPTMARVNTNPGIVMGTTYYMSPEQARGLGVDPRTDIFSFGVMLYEMVAGRLPFEGETSSHVVVSILEKEPLPLAHYRPETPSELERVITKALRKERAERYQTFKDLVADLKVIKQQLSSGAALLRSSGQRLIDNSPRPVTVTDKVTAHRTSGMEEMIDGIGQHRLALAALAVAVLALIGTGVYLLTGPSFALFVVAVLALIGTGVYLSKTSSKTIDSIAILPLANVGADPETEYLSDGITESLINNLSQLPNLKVMSCSSVFRYKGRDIDLQTAGRELKVKTVLVGRVVQRGNGLMISLELVDVRDNRQLWGEQYNRKLADILQLQTEISQEISEKLRLKLSGEEQKQLTRRYTENTEAYRLYLKGRYYLNKKTEEDLNRSIDCFQQAIKIDPNYALAYAGMADSYAFLGDVGITAVPSKKAFFEAKTIALKALQIDETLAEAHTSLGHIDMHNYEWSEAEREFKRTLKLNPNFAPGHQLYSYYLIFNKRTEESLKEMSRALELDPLSLGINSDLGEMFFLARQYDKAIEQLQKTLEMDPNRLTAHLKLGQVYQQKGMFNEAIAEFQKAKKLSSESIEALAFLGHTYAVSGKRDEALKMLTHLNELSKTKYVSPYNIALIHAGLDEKDQVFKWLEKGYEDHAEWMIFLSVDPRFDSLHTEPRFVGLVRRIGLAV
jgi:eukaryotic-like serine/threonine-protein kinase